MRGNDQECGVYKEKNIMRKIKERGEKIRVKVLRAKVMKKRRGGGRGTEKRREGRERRSTKERRGGRNKLEE